MSVSEDQSREAEDLFKSAVEVDPAQRVVLIEVACRGRPALRREVEALLGAFTESEGFLEAPVLGPRDERRDRHAHRMIGRRIGNYQIKSVIGSGGMGTVFLADQDHPRRTVALKIMRAGIPSRAAIRRFEYESEVLARLSHANVAQIYDAGVHEVGDAASTCPARFWTARRNYWRKPVSPMSNLSWPTPRPSIFQPANST